MQCCMCFVHGQCVSEKECIEVSHVRRTEKQLLQEKCIQKWTLKVFYKLRIGIVLYEHNIVGDLSDMKKYKFQKLLSTTTNVYYAIHENTSLKIY